VIDLHCHVLAGIDDGPETIEGSVALARVAAERGTRTIVATPHVSWSYDNGPQTIARLVDQTNAQLARAGVEIDIVAGAEIAITRAAELDRETIAALTLGGGPWLLIEFPFSSASPGLDELVQELEEEGHRVVLAHVERCPAFQRDPSMLESLVLSGALASITAGSLAGSFGSTARRFALELLDAELVHNVASDAHDAEKRPPGISRELEQSGFGALTEWLTESVPAAILAGEQDIPPRPAVTVTARPADRGASWWRRGPFRRAS
jgi:protein-tyrosine phosphatase